MATRPKTGGRQKGTPNKKSVAQRVRAIKGGILPLDYMLKVMRAPIPKNLSEEEKRFEKARRDKMADCAAPYLHSKLQAVNKAGSSEIEIVVQDETSRIEKARRVAFVLAQGAKAAKAAKGVEKA